MLAVGQTSCHVRSPANLETSILQGCSRYLKESLGKIYMIHIWSVHGITAIPAKVPDMSIETSSVSRAAKPLHDSRASCYLIAAASKNLNKTGPSDSDLHTILSENKIFLFEAPKLWGGSSTWQRKPEQGAMKTLTWIATLISYCFVFIFHFYYLCQ